MIALVLLIGAGLGWIVRSAQIQRDAVAAIRQADGGVRYRFDWRKGNARRGQKPPAPGWLADLIGIDYLDHVTTVMLSEPSKPQDAAIAQIGI